jgi:DNA-binding response OmpR family regulator
MTNCDSFCPDARRWKAAYRAAVLEPNRYTIPRRVSEAEEAIVARTRELSQESGVEAEIERNALDHALYSLRALGYAVENTTRAARTQTSHLVS